MVRLDLNGMLAPLTPRSRTTSNNSLRDLAMEAVGLGGGVTWVCRPDTVPSSDGCWATTVSECALKRAQQRGGKVTVDDICQALRNPQDTIDDEGDCNICVYEPEQMAELDYCRWDGDGHFDLSGYVASDPPSLGQVIVYVRMVERAKEHAAVTLLVHSQALRAKAAVLAGAVLVLARGYHADDAWQMLLESARAPSSDPAQAWDRFPRPFSAKHQTTSSSVTVLDCLRGLQRARDLGWLEDYRTFDLLGWRMLRRKLDASWIIPGEVLALGDPAFTAENPAFPELREEMQDTEEGSLPDVYALKSEKDQDDSRTPNRGTPSTCTPKTTGQLSYTSLEEALLRLDNFASFFDRARVRCLVRLNFATEGGGHLLPDPLRNTKVDRLHHEFKDCDIPPPKVLESFLEETEQARDRIASDGGAIAIHCKAGLGRTAIVIGAYAARHYDFDGAAFHGWVRMARPGSVQFPKQEHFLRSMRVGVAERQRSKSASMWCLPGATVKI